MDRTSPWMGRPGFAHLLAGLGETANGAPTHVLFHCIHKVDGEPPWSRLGTYLTYLPTCLSLGPVYALSFRIRAAAGPGTGVDRPQNRTGEVGRRLGSRVYKAEGKA